ncbi:hypothetical protein Sme01_21800 [Sphaerisporangium melleum]|uniref:Uncharacterized protein n=1 Tax=Sphaerisporangium melleum TaxID=321316 RepID=A0A917VHR4_9ACTN|nr:hypothetical protein [Sphaerisporangium melleum]GGK79420.1 hypothetical protein GCM10007964_22580 [Sphaerisporangium melleum]GII69704.1 hypothetical protein Sme01_21800 [Sphaerisporangium melleum]
MLRPGQRAATDAYERRCLQVLRVAYPPRFMKTRGAEMLGTLLDLAEPGRSRPSARTVLDVLRGGLALRLRERPPLRHWLPYWFLGWRLPDKYRWWARDDLLGAFLPERRLLGMILLVGLPLALRDDDQDLRTQAGRAIVWSLTYLTCRLTASRTRRRLLAKHGFHPDGTPYPATPSTGRRRASSAAG